MPLIFFSIRIAKRHHFPRFYFSPSALGFIGYEHDIAARLFSPSASRHSDNFRVVYSQVVSPLMAAYTFGLRTHSRQCLPASRVRISLSLPHADLPIDRDALSTEPGPPFNDGTLRVATPLKARLRPSFSALSRCLMPLLRLNIDEDGPHIDASHRFFQCQPPLSLIIILLPEMTPVTYAHCNMLIMSAAPRSRASIFSALMRDARQVPSLYEPKNTSNAKPPPSSRLSTHSTSPSQPESPAPRQFPSFKRRCH